MNKDSDKTKKQLIAELAELREKSKKQEEKLKAANQQLEAQNQQLQATEQQLRAANQQLTASEAKYKNLSLLKKAILESPEGIVVFALDKNYCYLDFTLPHKQTMKAIWGVDIEIGDNMLDYIKFKPDREKAKKNFDRALKGERFVLYEEYGDEKLKRNFYEDRYSPVYDENDNIIGLSVYVIDITERKQAEEALSKSEEMFRTVADYTYDWEYWENPDNSIKYISPACERITGYSVDEYILNPKLLENIVFDEDKEIWNTHLHENEKQTLREIQFRIKRKDGEIVWIEHACRPATNNKGDFLGYRVSNRDITERKQAEEKLKATNQQLNASNQQLLATEQQLRANNQQLIASEKALKENEKKYRKVFENSPSGIMLIDENGIIREANAAISKIMGYSIDELIGSDVKKLTLPENKNLVNQNIRRILSGELLEQEVISCRKDGSHCTLVLRETAIKLPNGKTGILSISDDITNQKIAEASLKDSEKKNRELSTLLRLMADNIPDMLWAKNLNNEYIFVNKAMCTGLLNAKDTNEPLGKTDMFFARRERNAHPDNPEWHTFGELCRDTDTTTLKAMKPMQFDEFGNVKGKFLFLDVHKAPLYDSNEHLIGTVGSARDVTAAKEAEKQLIKLSTAVTQSPAVIIIADTEGKIEYVNPKFTEITGYSFDEVMGKIPRILKSGEQPYEMYKELWETITSGKVWRGEFQNKKKNGDLYWESASISPIFDEQGNIINYIKVAEDITGLKQAEDNFRNSIDESPLGIRIVNQAGKTIYVNKALLDIYEYSSLDEFNNTKAIDRYTGKSYREHQERKKIRQQGGDVSDYEISIRRKNGEIRHIKVWRKEVIWNREKHFQVINQDITELKRLNSDLIMAKEKAEESDRLKTAFLNNMSHEIRTPLNGITGFITLLQDSEIDDKQKQEFFDIINRSSDRLIATVTDIMDISRIEAGEVKVSKSEVPVNEILEEQYKFFYQQAKSKGLELNYKLSLSDRESRIITDKHKLEGILTNLIKNAIKFTDAGSITFGYTIKTQGEKDIVEFYVKDTGIGIPADRVDAVFNRFEQADIEDTRAFEGSGLGLAIAKSYVEMLGGKISVKSKEGEGSTFTFTIPYTKPLEKKSDVKQNINNEPLTSLSHLSLIIAEDDETSKLLYETIFKNKFKKIIYTTTGKETIEKLRENPDTDVILMDIRMPDINGYDATREIRNFNKEVIIIAQTAFGLSGDREKAIAAGCNDYITKPVNKNELQEMIQKHFDK